MIHILVYNLTTLSGLLFNQSGVPRYCIDGGLGFGGPEFEILPFLLNGVVDILMSLILFGER